ncbi:MAG: glycerol-3-phosphate 1-O-acyltransferase PlsY [Candidatus Aceula lacicola]|nr:glycerol-3-phosphate 1-O-acyltransferase PlsY [Candidatus Aceula lacicola]
MLQLIKILFGLGLSYLLGSIPTAYIAGKFYKGIDIREHGSRNVGATNVFRVLGKVPGTIVLVIDILKGVLAVALVSSFLGLESNIFYILFGMASVCGHNWTVFLNFKGGKGVATSLGVLIGLTIKIISIRAVLALAVLIWAGVFIGFGYVSLASIVSVIFLPLLMLVFTHSFELVVLGVVFCVFVVIRHRPNIQRLLDGKESKVKMPFLKKIVKF